MCKKCFQSMSVLKEKASLSAHCGVLVHRWRKVVVRGFVFASRLRLSPGLKEIFGEFTADLNSLLSELHINQVICVMTNKNAEVDFTRHGRLQAERLFY